MVAVKVDVTFPAASHALLDPLGVGVGDAGQLGDAELKAELRDELKWREAEKRVRERELENDRGWARADLRVHKIAVAQRLFVGAQRVPCRLVDSSRPPLLQFRNHQVFIGVWFHVARGVEQVSGAAHGQLGQLVRGVCTERGEAGLQLGQGWLSKAGEAIEMEEDSVGVRRPRLSRRRPLPRCCPR